MTSIAIYSPLDGWAAPLETVPDPVFADAMLGHGVAIHPTAGTVKAPSDGVVLTLHDAGHAITIASACGAEILIHVGLDTVALHGVGFTPRVSVGDKVSRGDPLIDFDMDYVALRARSLVTPVIITNGDRFRVDRFVISRSVKAGDLLMSLNKTESDEQHGSAGGGEALSQTLKIPMAHGIHARPAARIVAAARDFKADLTLVLESRRASAKSVVALLGLGASLDSVVTIEARGEDAAAALSAVAGLIAGGMGEAGGSPETPAPAVSDVRPTSTKRALLDGQLGGVMASRGIASGPAFRLQTAEIAVPRDGQAPDIERKALQDAIDGTRLAITDAASTGDAVSDDIMIAHLAFLDDAELTASARQQIEEGRSAGFAWRSAIRAQVSVMRELGDPRFAERADDLLDIERRVLARLVDETVSIPIPAGSIVLARDLLPSQLLGMDTASIAGFCLEQGGPTSHVAIIAASRDLPAIVAMGDALDTIATGTELIIDADDAVLIVDPDEEVRQRYERDAEERRRRSAEALRMALEPCRTTDGTRIELFANLGSVIDAELAGERGAEGCGLLRTELLFLDRQDAPDAAEQAAYYQSIVDALGGRPVIVRLLDIGGDKPASYLPLPAEENPALGLRGIRIASDQPEIFRQQIHAILRVAPSGRCRIMVPMVSSVSELRMVRDMVGAAARELDVAIPPVGAMIETPAAAVTADLLAAEADFVSIGTNDLTQYTLAMDRGNQAVADQIDALHPAVLRMIARACDDASRAGCPVGVCGSAASDPAAIPILIGLGVSELSVTPRFVPEAKAIVRRLSVDSCRSHAARALDLSASSQVRELARQFAGEISS